MEHFSHLGTSNSSRSITTPNSFMYLPSSVHHLHHEQPPPNFQNRNNATSNPNPNSSQQNSENIGSSQNPYARRFSDISSDRDQESIKSKIVSHPQYSALLVAYMDCQKVGAPPQVAERLSSISQEIEAKKAAMNSRRDSTSQDPELDQFMEAYCNMLIKYREELIRPLHEAMDFLKRVESQLNSMTNNGASSSIFTNDERSEGVGSSEEDQDQGSGGEGNKLPAEIDPRAEDKELKNHLLKKYSGYLSSLRHELSKKKKKGKLPKEARQKLLNWWELHYKWPYPSESEKVALAESTGLDQKQINNWFINQRKRHWKPSEDMQFVVMDAFHPQNAAALYMGGGQYMGDATYRLGH